MKNCCLLRTQMNPLTSSLFRDECTTPYTIRLDRPVGEGVFSLVYEACTPKEIEEDLACNQVAKLTPLFPDLEGRSKVYWERQELIPQERAAKLNISPKIRDAFVCSGEEYDKAKFFKGGKGPSQRPVWNQGIIIMDKVEGVTLEDYLKQKKISQKLCDQLETNLNALQEAGVYHGDLLPSNVYVDTNEKPIFIDSGFGFAFDDAKDLLNLHREHDYEKLFSGLDSCKQNVKHRGDDAWFDETGQQIIDYNEKYLQKKTWLDYEKFS